MFQLLTELPLFEVFEGLESRTIDDNHLIFLSEVIGPLPGTMLAKWPRYANYFGLGGERLHSQPLDFDKSDMGRRLQAYSTKEFMDPPKPEATMEDKFHRNKPRDIDYAEGRQIASLLRNILQIDPLKRPSAADLLLHPWFNIEP